MRIRIRLAAALAIVALGVVAIDSVAVASAATSSATPTSPAALDTLHVAGVTKSGKQFKGTYGIQRFVAGGQKVLAVGVLKGTFKGHHITRYNVELPASLTGTSNSGSARDAQASSSCAVLHLVLAPINLNLLGLKVTLGGGTLANQPIVLDITAVSGAGNLLGNLLCGLTNALNQGGTLSSLTGQLQQLSSVLNGLIGLLGGIGA